MRIRHLPNSSTKGFTPGTSRLVVLRHAGGSETEDAHDSRATTGDDAFGSYLCTLRICAEPEFGADLHTSCQGLIPETQSQACERVRRALAQARWSIQYRRWYVNAHVKWTLQQIRKLECLAKLRESCLVTNVMLQECCVCIHRKGSRNERDAAHALASWRTMPFQHRVVMTLCGFAG